MTQPKNFEEKLVRLRRYSDRLNRMMENGAFYQLSFFKRFRLIRKVKRLYSALLGPVSAPQLQLIMAAASVFVMGATCNWAGGGTIGAAGFAGDPSFEPPHLNPFGVSPVSGSAIPVFVDIDDDGDYDLFVSVRGAGGEPKYFQNIGTRSSPLFAGPVTAPFGMPWGGNGVYEGVSTFADMDGNGTFDIIVGDTWNETRYYRNTGARTAPAFTDQGTPSGLPNGGPPYSLFPTAVNIDGDGDYDVIIGGEDYGGGTISYYRNTSSIFSLEPNPPGLTTSGYYPVPTFVDIDADGDFDAFIGLQNGNIEFFENTGTAGSPAFNLIGTLPPGLTSVSSLAAPTFVDIDGDGDFDAFIGDGSGNIWYFENTNL